MSEREAAREVLVVLKRKLKGVLPRECFLKALGIIEDMEETLDEYTYVEAVKKWG